MHLHFLFLLCLFVVKLQGCLPSEFDASGVCQPCNIVCSTCSGSSSSSCTGCTSTRTYESSAGTCNCIDGYQQTSPVSADCEKISCSYSCLTCNNTADFCTSCPVNSYRSLVAGSGTCLCNSKYYDSGNPVCTGCHYTCQQCTDTSSSSCSSCNTTKYRIPNGTGGCKCMDKYFNSGSNQLCLACNYKCKTCVSPSTNCLTCGLNRGSAPGCLCSQGFYDDGASQSCQVCQYSCKTCTSSSSCASCDGVTAFRELVSEDSYCVCLDRYFEASPGTLVCSSCHPTCFQCVGSNSYTACSACSSLANRQLSGSVCECKLGFYQTDPNVELCSACDYKCRSCSVISTNCTDCSSSLFRTLINNQCPCIDGYYQSLQTGLCVRCQSSCLTCTNGTQCATCDTVIKLYSLDANKLCSCEDTTYFNTTQNKCISCSVACKTCSQTSPTYCLSCDTGRTLMTNTCPCLPYHYENGAICSPCHYSCQTCNGPLINNCLTCSSSNNRDTPSNGQCNCKAGYYDDGTNVLCLQCSYECSTCTDGSTCSNCDSSKFRSIPSTKCQCIGGYFQNSTLQCQKCAYHCLTCTDSVTCLTCNTPNRALNTTTLKCDCPNRFYDNGVSQTCFSCLPECKTCTNSTKCTSCQISQFRALSGTFRCPCIAKYYALSGVCTPCLYHCATCSSGAICLTCNSTANRVINLITNKCDCKPGYFDTGIEECQKCSYACNLCIDNANKCIYCNPVQRILNNNWCECPIKFYDNNSTVICPSCQYTCESCTNSTHCSTCNLTKFRTFDTLNVRCLCLDKYYDDGSNELCKTCSYRCKTCTNSTKCLTCDATKYRITPESLCPCMAKYYDSGTNSQNCLPCHYSCLTCTNGLSCSTCESSTNHRIFDSLTNLCKCQDKFYDDGTNEQCLPCVYSCATCATSSSACLTCGDLITHRQLVNGSCLCQKRYFDQSLAQVCVGCQYSCETCSDTISCDSCDAVKHRQINPINNLCACMIGYFDDHSNNQTCQQCHLSCVTCDSTLSCLTCDASKKRLLNNSVSYNGSVSQYCICQYGFYSPGDSLTCQPCHYSCEVCSGPNFDNCLFCDSLKHRSLSSNKKCKCVNGFYDDGTNQLCLPCHNSCTKCTGPNVNQCSSCINTKFYMSNQTKCYDNCPSFTFNKIDGMICSSCSSHCFSCLNQNLCTECQTSYYLFSQDKKCYAICPDGYWQNTVSKSCQVCPQGCKTCESNLNCLQCLDHYYLDFSATLCFSCYSNCKSCFGPAQDQCTSCYQSLYFKSNKCHNLTCPYGQYVDSTYGCQNCTQKFSNSLTCNKTQPFLCLSAFKLKNSQCKICSQIQGYHIANTTNTCSQICGDGKLYDYQCDDGNQLDGDGCSKNCIIQKDWSCNASGLGSISTCRLEANLSMSLKKMTKHAGENKITISFTISLPFRLIDDFNVTIQSLNYLDFQWEHSQNLQNLTQVTLFITYSKNLQGKKIIITYGDTQTRRLLQQTSQIYMNKRRVLTLSTIIFNTELQIAAFPPANFYASNQKQFFDSAQQIIHTLALILLIISLLAVPKRTHLHSFTFSYIIPKTWLIFCLALQQKLDWVNYVFKDIKMLSMFGGFSLGNCCKKINEFYNFSSELISNSFFILLALIIVWILVGISYLVFKYFIKKIEIWNYAKYFALTAHILLIFPIFYTSLNALNFYSLENIVDAFNITLSIAISIFSLFLVILSWYVTFKTEYSTQKFEKKKIFPQNFQQKSINDSKAVQSEDPKIVITQKKRIGTIFQHDFFISEQNQVQSMQDLSNEFTNKQKSKSKIEQRQNVVIVKQQMLNPIVSKQMNEDLLYWDYVWLYQQERKGSKYFMPFTLTLLYIQAIVLVFLGQWNSLYFMIAELLLQVIYFMYILFQRPFKSRFTNSRIAITSVMFIIMESLMIYYLKSSQKLQYFKLGEILFVYFCGVAYLLAILFCLLQHIISWKQQLYNLIQPCLIRFLLNINVRDHDTNPNFKTTQNLISNTPQQKIQPQEIQTPQIDVFYMRIMKKQKANKKYRKERKMKESLYSPY